MSFNGAWTYREILSRFATNYIFQTWFIVWISFFFSDCGWNHIPFLCASISSLSLFGHLSCPSLGSPSPWTPTTISVARILRGTTLTVIFWIAEECKWMPLVNHNLRLMGSSTAAWSALLLQLLDWRVQIDDGSWSCFALLKSRTQHSPSIFQCESTPPCTTAALWFMQVMVCANLPFGTTSMKASPDNGPWTSFHLNPTISKMYRSFKPWFSTLPPKRNTVSPLSIVVWPRRLVGISPMVHLCPHWFVVML